ncbi:PREDICTED: uncharacterized protein LOC107343146 [Acropora digitifera]|uniref:uncharacterized protein LOC107343146 n=1 Tax=Acropora digitifera TaxID=70779 RepID=UPI00077A4B59|nr:PREDICTED: uncharacterized protein LOC107343146 [Acropora digitifera]
MRNRYPILWLHFCLFVILASFIRSCGCQRSEIDFEWQGNKRAIALEDATALSGKAPRLAFKRGTLCGWTPHGLCFSPDEKGDINNFFVIPFNALEEGVYSDQATFLGHGKFYVNSYVLAFFDEAKDKSSPWSAKVRSYRANGFGHVTSLVAETYYKNWGLKQIKQTFLPHQVRIEGAHDACLFFKTNCKHNEYCIPRRVRGYISPGEYRCECKKGWQYARGRGCLDIDECKGRPCGVYHLCVNTPGSFSCQCRAGYKGPKCDADIDEFRWFGEVSIPVAE